MKCTQCGAEDLVQGFVSDLGQGARGYSRWVLGPVELGLLGYARLMGRPRWQIDAYRCPHCTHLEFFAPMEAGRRSG